MNLFWWLIWIALVFWVFAAPNGIPDQRKSRYTALDILKKRFTSGQLTKEEYKWKCEMLKDDSERLK